MGAALSVPDLTLVGHTADAEFALGISTSEPLVASGGQDKDVCHCPFGSRQTVV